MKNATWQAFPSAVPLLCQNRIGLVFEQEPMLPGLEQPSAKSSGFVFPC